MKKHRYQKVTSAMQRNKLEWCNIKWLNSSIYMSGHSKASWGAQPCALQEWSNDSQQRARAKGLL